MKKPLLIITLFILIIVGLSVFKVAISNKLSTTGIELENIQSRISVLKKENVLLEEKVLEASSLINISKKAKTLGFVEAKSQIYISNQLPLALKQ